MYHSPTSLIPIPPKFSLELPAPCKDKDKLRQQLEACLINESSLLMCASVFIKYKQCLGKIDQRILPTP